MQSSTVACRAGPGLASWTRGLSGREEFQMSKIHFLGAALLAFSAVASAAPGATVNLDGSTNTRQKGPTLAASASRQLQNANVPSTNTDPVDIKAAADADMAKRDSRVKPHLKAERQNLKGKDAARAIAEQQNPSTLDREMANGNIDHTEQVTNLKVYIKK
jgi:hypothetical protein